MAKQGKAARALARARSFREKSKAQMGEYARAGAGWFGAGWTGDRMAQDEQKDPTGKNGIITIAGRDLPKYEAGAAAVVAAMSLFQVKVGGPELQGAVRGAVQGVLDGAAAVRRYKFRLLNPLPA